MSEQTSSEGSPVPSAMRSRGPWWTSLRLWTVCACALLVLTVLILPLPIVVRAFILGVLIFSAVFVTVDAGGFGKTFAALTCTLLVLYLVYTADRGMSLLLSGSRIQMMAQQLSDSGDLAEDHLPRTPSGKVNREAATAEFESFAEAVEASPEDWKAWFNLACMYDAVGERKRARAAMRNAWSLRSGRAAKEMR